MIHKWNPFFQVLIDINEKLLERGDRLKQQKGASVQIRLLVLLFVVVIFSVFFTVGLRVRDTSFAWYLQGVILNFKNFHSFLMGELNSGGMNYTVYRILIVGFVGAALAVSGAVYQGVFRNPMASPGILGVQSGGVLAGSIYLFLFSGYKEEVKLYNYEQYMDYYNNITLFERYAQQIVIFIGAVVTVMLIVAIAKIAGGGRISTVTLLISASVFSVFISSGLELFRYYMIKMDPTDVRISKIQLFMMGSFENTYSLNHLLSIGIPVILCLILLILLGVKINTLVFGDEEAKTMGVSVHFLRNSLILLATILTVITISFCGQIGFIGLLVPHLARFLVGSDFRKLVPTAMILGASILMFVFDITTFLNMNIYINLFTSAIGGPLFIVLMLKARRERSAEWA